MNVNHLLKTMYYLCGDDDMKVKLEGFYYLKDALKYGSFSAAAEQNYMAQSNFSREIAKLEEALGVKLLERTGKGVVPTHTYLKIEKKLEDMLMLLDDIEAICQQEANMAAQDKSIVLGINWAMHHNIIRRVIGCIDCYEEEKDYDFSVKRSGNKELIDMLLQNTIDYALIVDWYDDIALFDKSKDLRFEKLFTDDIAVCVGWRSPYWNCESVTTEEVLRMPQLTFTEDLKYEEIGLYQLLGGMPTKLRYVSDLNTAIQIVRDTNNCLLSIKSFFLDEQSVQNGDVQLLRLKNSSKKISVYFAYRKANAKSENEQKFILDVKRQFLTNKNNSI